MEWDDVANGARHPIPVLAVRFTEHAHSERLQMACSRSQVLKKPLFWVLFIIQSALLTANDMMIIRYGTGLPPLEWKAVLVLSSLLTFFICLLYTSPSPRDS